MICASPSPRNQKGSDTQKPQPIENMDDDQWEAGDEGWDLDEAVDSATHMEDDLGDDADPLPLTAHARGKMQKLSVGR